MRPAALLTWISILVIVPVCGNVASVVWGALIAVLGLAQIHGTDQWRTLIAVVIPLIVCLSMCSGIFLFGAGLEMLGR